jgi:hypothetical protein
VEGFRAPPRLVLPAWNWSEALDPTAKPPAVSEPFSADTGTCGRLWIVISRETSAQRLFLGSEENWFLKYGYTHVTVSRFSPPHGVGINVLLLAR